MKRTVEISAGVAHHLDLANLQFCAGRAMLPGLFAAKKIADDRRREAFVGDQTVLNQMTEINEMLAHADPQCCSEVDDTSRPDPMPVTED